MSLTTTQKFIIGSVCLAIGTLLILLSAILDKTYFTFLLLLPVVLMALPLIMVPPNLGGDGSFFESFSSFFAGFCVFSIVGMLFVLKHVGAITTQDTILASLGLCFLTATVIFSAAAMKRDSMYMASY